MGIPSAGSQLTNYGIAAEATVGKYGEIPKLPRGAQILYAFAYVFAASAASAAKCCHTEVWAWGPNSPGPWALLCGSILLPKLLKQQKCKQMHMKSLSLSARNRRSESTQ